MKELQCSWSLFLKLTILYVAVSFQIVYDDKHLQTMQADKSFVLRQRLLNIAYIGNGNIKRSCDSAIFNHVPGPKVRALPVLLKEGVLRKLIF